LQTAETYADQHSYQQALDIYAQVIDTRLAIKEVLLISLFDQAITQFLPQLDMLLVAASSLIISFPSEGSNIPKISDPSNSIASSTPIPITILPLLNPEARCHWLERLFALWLKHLDTSPISEQLQETIFEVVWVEDIPYLRKLIESELQATSANTHHRYTRSFTNQLYIRSLEQFLKQLPQ
jgi:hypothetical protein